MPVLEHSVHERTSFGDEMRYGCNNAKPFKDGYFAKAGHSNSVHEGNNVYSTRQRWVWVEHRMSRDCRYDLSLNDPACRDCQQRGKGVEYNELLRTRGT